MNDVKKAQPQQQQQPQQNVGQFSATPNSLHGDLYLPHDLLTKYANAGTTLPLRIYLNTSPSGVSFQTHDGGLYGDVPIGETDTLMCTSHSRFGVACVVAFVVLVLVAVGAYYIGRKTHIQKK